MGVYGGRVGSSQRGGGWVYYTKILLKVDLEWSECFSPLCRFVLTAVCKEQHSKGTVNSYC